jgi:diguanylate cyclase (GGDEF)-like protein/PAS domain S-box-containing protein
VGAALDRGVRRWPILPAALALYIVIFTLTVTVEVPGGGFIALYVLPVGALGMQFGMRAGAAAALAALVLFVLGARIEGAEISVISFLLRGVVFFSVGLLGGAMAQRLRAASRANQEAANHFELSRDMLATADLEANLLHVNDAWQQTLGWTREEVVGHSLAEFVHPDDVERAWTEARKIRGGGGTHGFTFRCRTRDDRWRWLEWSSRLDADHRVVYAVARDVTSRVEEAERVNLGIDLSPVGIAVVGVLGENADTFLRVNAKLEEILGRPADELLGRNSLGEITHPDDRPALADAMAGLIDGHVKAVETECRIVRPDGEEVWVELTTGIVRDTDGVALYRLSHVLDITDRKHAESRLRYLADYDLLAGTVNRRRFEADLAAELERGDGGALLILDLDGFKNVNDSLGHAAGDAVIAQVGTALTRRLRGDTDVVGRLGGDEFAVLVRHIGADEARSVADDLRVAIRLALAGDEAEEIRAVTASTGLAAFAPGAAIDADDLMHVVDLAMYEAKEAGGDRVVTAAAYEMTHAEPRRQPQD